MVGPGTGLQTRDLRSTGRLEEGSMINTGTERRDSLRRLDDLLEALEQVNLSEAHDVPAEVVARLVVLGVTEPRTQSASALIEQVYRLQKPHLIDLKVERRGRRRRGGYPRLPIAG